MITEYMRLQHHVLYRAFDQHGSLLYVGITLNLPSRIATHRGTAAWWSKVSSISVEHHPTRDSALTAESIAITTESPLHNTLGMPGKRAIRVSDERIASPGATNVYLKPDVKAAILKWADANDRSMSQAINILCTDALDRRAVDREREIPR